MAAAAAPAGADVPLLERDLESQEAAGPAAPPAPCTRFPPAPYSSKWNRLVGGLAEEAYEPYELSKIIGFWGIFRIVGTVFCSVQLW